jgi:hypothetical protein
LGVTVEKSDLVIAVRDTDIGIDKATLDNVWTFSPKISTARKSRVAALE